jgi:hypothetical protein
VNLWMALFGIRPLNVWAKILFLHCKNLTSTRAYHLRGVSLHLRGVSLHGVVDPPDVIISIVHHLFILHNIYFTVT